ncbi:hypothetical protein HYU13_06715 [Candidatus Woesearchaeota archaeon]|nr:hypothetical protein [Candidatus Woesearchaeota archaeon]
MNQFWRAAIMLLAVLFLLSCKTTGRGYFSGEGFSASRSVLLSTVTIDIAFEPAQIADNEIVLLAEEMPPGVSVASGSANPPADFEDGKRIIWIFTKGYDQQLGIFQLSKRIPESVSYQISGSADAPSIKGSWGLKEANKQGLVST